MGKAAATNDEDDLLTLDEVAARLKVTKRTVQNMIARGDFVRVVKITDSDVRIPLAVYREFVRNRTVNYEAMAA